MVQIVENDFSELKSSLTEDLEVNKEILETLYKRKFAAGWASEKVKTETSLKES